MNPSRYFYFHFPAIDISVYCRFIDHFQNSMQKQCTQIASIQSAASFFSTKFWYVDFAANNLNYEISYGFKWIFFFTRSRSHPVEMTTVQMCFAEEAYLLFISTF